MVYNKFIGAVTPELFQTVNRIIHFPGSVHLSCLFDKSTFKVR